MNTLPLKQLAKALRTRGISFKSEIATTTLEEIARLLWTNMPFIWDTYGDEGALLAALRWGVRIPGGAIGFTEDETESGLWWVEATSERWTISPKTMRGLLVMCGLLGAKVVATRTDPYPRQGRFWEIVGLQKLEDNLYSINVEPPQDKEIL